MIHSTAFYQKSATKHMTSSLSDTFAINISNPKNSAELGKEFYDELKMEFLDDIYPMGELNVMSFEQSREIIKALDKIESLPYLLGVSVFCDTGKTVSPAIVQFISERYPRVKHHQDLTKTKINKHVLATLRICTYPGSKPSKVNTLMKNIWESYWNLEKTVDNATRRSTKENLKSLLKWLKDEF